MYVIVINCKITYTFYISRLIVHLVCYLRLVFINLSVLLNMTRLYIHEY